MFGFGLCLNLHNCYEIAAVLLGLRYQTGRPALAQMIRSNHLNRVNLLGKNGQPSVNLILKGSEEGKKEQLVQRYSLLEQKIESNEYKKKMKIEVYQIEAWTLGDNMD
ncbi:hypothetical protein SCA6_018105 [Theobroma cacao]